LPEARVIQTTSLARTAVATITLMTAPAWAAFDEQASDSHDALDQAFDPSLPAPGGVAFGGSFATLGTLSAEGGTYFKVTYTFLGREAAYTDTMVLDMGSTMFDNKHTALGTTFTTYQGAGLLDFSFYDVKGYGTANGDVFGVSPVISWGLLEGATSMFGPFDYIIGLNDSAGGKTRDYDDMVIGINVSLVPEAGTFAMAAAGIGCILLLGARRSRG